MEDMECDFECDNKSLILEFISLTNASENIAIECLSSCDWNLQVAATFYFESCGLKSSHESRKTFKVISWNIDGLDENQIYLRLNLFLTIITENKPEFLFLQEVSNYSEEVIRLALAKDYEFFFDSKKDFYYCGIMVMKSHYIKLMSELNIFEFSNSKMGRNLLSIVVNVFGLNIKLMTSHLESMKDSSEERKKQLRTAFSEMTQANLCSIFGGDLNIRDYELRQINGPPDSVVDVCEHLCDNAKDMATWEPGVNKNISSDLAHVPGMRFDRIYIQNALNPNLTPVEFQLLGQTVIDDFDLHASDHWAVCCVFSC